MDAASDTPQWRCGVENTIKRETDAAAGLQGSESSQPAPKWTVMVFMGAGRGDGNDASLDQYAWEDIAEMASIFADGPVEGLDIFVELHGLDNGPAPFRRWINRNVDEQVPVRADGVQDGTALTEFIDWSIDKADYHKYGGKKHSLLILWGHAYEFAIGHEPSRSGLDALDFGELAEVLERFQDRMQEKHQLPASLRPRLDIIAFDACDTSTIEIANLLEPFADFLIASQIGIPLPGWPYKLILERLKASQEAQPMSPAQFGAFAVRKFCENYAGLVNGQPIAVSLTLLDLRLAPEVFVAAEQLAAYLAAAGGSDAGELATIRQQFVQSQTFDDKPFVDAAELCLNLTRFSGDEDVRLVASALGDLLVHPYTNGAGTRNPFIVEHGRNSHETAKLQGVGLYAPQLVSESEDWRASRFWYNKFSSRETVWSRVVHLFAEEP